MNFISRGCRSILRKPITKITLILIIFFLALFLLLTIAIYQGQSGAQDELQNQIGGSFRLILSMEDLLQRTEEYWPVYGLEFEDLGFTMFVAPDSFYTLLRHDIQKISELPGIGRHNVLSAPFVLHAQNFHNISDRSDDLLVDVRGVLDWELLDEVIFEFIALKEGNSEQDGIANPLFISDELAQKNNVSIGDILNFEWQDVELDIVLSALGRERHEPIEVSGTVAGIFSIERPIQSHTNWARPENTIYTTLDFRETVLEPIIGYGHRGHNYELATFQIDGTFSFEEMKSNILDLDIDWSRYELVSADDIIQRMSGNIELLERTSRIWFGVLMGTGFLILSLTFVLFTKSRSHEIAILLSVGVQRMEVFIQILFEAFVVTALAFSISLAIFPSIIPFIEIENLIIGNMDDDILPYTAMMGGNESALNLAGADLYEWTINDISLSARVILPVMFVLLALVFVSVLVSCIPIMKLKPRQIFSRLS